MTSPFTRSAPRPLGALGVVGLVWSVGGVSVLLLGGVFSVLPHALEIEPAQRSPAEWAALVAFGLFMLVGKGYFGFHRSFSPRTAGRAWELSRDRRPLVIALGPLYAMCLVMAPRPRMLRSWALVLAIAAIVPLVGAQPQPWRGIVDIGVVLGLGVGLASFWWHAWRWPTSAGRRPGGRARG